MGMFSEQAKIASKYLKLGKGEKIEVKWTGEAVKIKDIFGKEGFEFTFETNYGKKLYTITQPSQYSKFDQFKAGDILILDRSQQKPDGRYKFEVYKKEESDISF